MVSLFFILIGEQTIVKTVELIEMCDNLTFMRRHNKRVLENTEYTLSIITEKNAHIDC